MYVPSPRDGDAVRLRARTRFPRVARGSETRDCDFSSSTPGVRPPPIVLRPIVLRPTSPAPTSFFVDGVRVSAVAPGEREWAAAAAPPGWTEKPRGAFARRVASHVFGRRRDAREGDVPGRAIVRGGRSPRLRHRHPRNNRASGGRRARVRIRVRVVEGGDDGVVRRDRERIRGGYSTEAGDDGASSARRLRRRVASIPRARRHGPKDSVGYRGAQDAFSHPREERAIARDDSGHPREERRSPASPHRPWSASFELALGRVSFLAQSSDARVGGFGVAGDETAALVTLAALRVSARTGPARDGFTALGVETSFESAHALDVSGTSAGEAERMAAGVTLSERFADAGVPLAWIGSSATGSRTSVALRALVDPSSVASSIPSSARVDVALGGGGVAANVPAWDRVVALRAALADEDDESRDVGENGGQFAATPEKQRARKTVTFADEVPVSAEVSARRGDGEHVSERMVKISASTGEWTMTLPWNPSNAARARFESYSTPPRPRPRTSTPRPSRRRGGPSRLASDASSSRLRRRRGTRATARRRVRWWRFERCASASSGGGVVQRRLRGRQRRRGVGGILASIASLGEASRLFDDASRPAAATTPVDGRPPPPRRRSSSLPSPRAWTRGHDRRTRVCEIASPRRANPPSFENLGAPIVEAAALGLSASLATDPARVALNVESRLSLDFLNHDKGAWEPLVEPGGFASGWTLLSRPTPRPRARPPRSPAWTRSSSSPPRRAPPRLPRRRRRCAAALPRTPRRTRREATTRTGYETPRAFLSSIGSPRMNRRRRTTNRARRPNRRRRTSSHPEDARCYTSPR